MKNNIRGGNLVVIWCPLLIIQLTSSSSTSTGALLRTSGFFNCDSWDGFDCEFNCEFLKYAILIYLESLRDSKISLNEISFYIFNN